MAINYGGNDWSSDPQTALRMQLAKGLMQGQQAPAQGFGENVANLGSKLIGAYLMKQGLDEGKARDSAKNDTLANALRAGQGQAAETKSYGDGTTINWDERKADPAQMASILAGNKDTAPIGLQMQIGQMDEKRKNESAMATEMFKNRLSRENEFYKPIKTDDGSVIIPALTPGFQMPGQVPAPTAPQAAPAPALRTASTTPVDRPDTSHTPGYVAQVTGIENSTGDPAARNRRSSAMGDGQFIAATWLDIVKRNRPDLVQGKSDQDILALRADPKISAEMTDIYGTENADLLRSGGIQNVGNAEKYAAHFFGPSGAVKVLTADPNTPISDLLGPGVIKANPQLAKLTAGQWRTANALKFGAGQEAQPPRVQVADASGTIPASVQAPAAPPNQPGVLYQGRGKGVRAATPEELAQYGLPKNASAQVDLATGRFHVVNKGDEGGGGPFGGNGLPAQDSNLWIQFQTKMANGETLTPQEQLAMALIQQRAEQARMMMTDQGIVSVPGTPLPTMPGRQPAVAPAPAPAAATDTVPNPLAPAPAAPAPGPAPTSPQQPTVIVPRSAKPIPEGIQKGMTENVTALRKIEDTLAAITKTPDATGMGVGAVNQVMPNAVTNFMFPDGVNARALIADIGSMKIHDRSGAAVSVAEFPRLAPFVPSASDSPDVVKTKLENFQREYINTLNDMNSEYGADKGYSVNSTVAETLKTGRTPRYQAPLPGEDPNKPKSAASGLSNEDILKQLGM